MSTNQHPHRAPLIAVCGTGEANADEAAAAHEVGRLVAKHGSVVVCGGLGGVMAAVAQGVAASGGTCIGMLPGDDPEAAGDDMTIVLATGLGELRNGLIARCCRAMIAIGGGYGTLSEIGFMLRLGRPVAGLATWNIAAPGSDQPEPRIHWAADAADAVGWVFEALAS